MISKLRTSLFKNLSFKFLVFLLAIASINAQAEDDPCDTGQGGPGCQVGGGDTIIFSPFDSVPFDQPFKLFVAAGQKSTGKIDTTYTGTITLAKVSGPGNFTGTMTMGITRWSLFDDLKCDAEGTYTISMGDGVLPSIQHTFVCSKQFKGDDPLGGNAVKSKFFGLPSELPVNNPFNLLVEAVDIANNRDGTYTQPVSIEQVDGPGTLSGTLTANYLNGEADFQNLSVDQAGQYRFRVISGSLEIDTTGFIEAKSGGPGGPSSACSVSSVGQRTNLGLYGGSSLDLTFEKTSGALFAAISTPASLFRSLDTGRTWLPAFSDDSLEYDCERGWGGRALRVLSNDSGWVAVLTSQEAGTLTSSVFSDDHGKPNTWKTAFDGAILDALGKQKKAIRAIALTDFWMYAAAENYVGRLNTSGIDVGAFVDASTVTGAPNNPGIVSIAAANSQDGLPVYLCIDTVEVMNSNSAKLYKYDGSTMSLITLPAGVKNVTDVFTHPHQESGDTLFINAYDGSNNLFIYRSLDGGSTWVDVNPSGNFWGLSDVDYSNNWSVAATSGGLAISIPGVGYSFDMGDTWNLVSLVNNGMAIHPMNHDIIIGTKGRGVVKSEGGAAGPFTLLKNFGLEAVKINKIVRNEDKTLFYVATDAGLAVTTEYLNNSIPNDEKWSGAHGKFPIQNVGDDAGISAVAIDPSDTAHVIAGYSNGFSVTTTGRSGFGNVNPAGWNASNDDPEVRDIAFYSSNIVIAVTGGENQSHSGAGNIWRSADGGASWSKVTPSSGSPFSTGNCVVVGFESTDTVIYVGTGLEQSIHPNDQGKLWESTDRGLTWTEVNTGPDATNGPKTELPIHDIAVDPRDNDVIYLATGSNLDNAFVKSTDGGATYQTINVTGEGAFTSVAIDPDEPDSVYMAIRRELYLYEAAADSVVLGFRGLPGELIPDIVIGSVIAGTSTGMWTLDLEFTAINTLSVDEVLSTDNSMVVFPNPTTGELNIKLINNLGDNITVELYDLFGKKYQLINAASIDANNSIQVDLSGFANGTYLLSVKDENWSETQKVLIVR